AAVRATARTRTPTGTRTAAVASRRAREIHGPSDEARRMAPIRLRRPQGRVETDRVAGVRPRGERSPVQGGGGPARDRPSSNPMIEADATTPYRWRIARKGPRDHPRGPARRRAHRPEGARRGAGASEARPRAQRPAEARG